MKKTKVEARPRTFDVRVRFQVAGVGDDDGARQAVADMLQWLHRGFPDVTRDISWQIESTTPSSK